LGSVAQAYNPRYSRVRDLEDHSSRPDSETSQELISTNKSLISLCTLSHERSINRRIVVQASLSI
jgi:hypothetical protein